MAEAKIERFKAGTRLLHWTVTISALTLAVTGLFLFVPAFGSITQDSYTRVIHKIAAIFLIGSPTLYLFFNPKESLKFVKEAFKWGEDDLKWLKAAPDYYFGGKGEDMPAQPHINTGQKMWWLVCVLCWTGFAITGIIMWVTGTGGGGALLAAAVIHDICFIVGGSMLLVHLYLGSLHPKMNESFKSMITGKISKEYAEDHYGKWYEEEARGKKE